MKKEKIEKYNRLCWVGFLIILIILFFLVTKWSPYPDKHGNNLEIRYDVFGECLEPTGASSVYIDLEEHEISILGISVNKSCSAGEGRIDFKITSLLENVIEGNPKVTFHGRDKPTYKLNKSKGNEFSIYTNLNSTKEGIYRWSITSNITEKFYSHYDIISNTYVSRVDFYYPTSFFGYSCSNCISLTMGNIRDGLFKESKYETGDRVHKRFLFDDGAYISIQFNPKNKYEEILKDFFRGLLISMIAAIMVSFIIREKDSIFGLMKKLLNNLYILEQKILKLKWNI